MTPVPAVLATYTRSGIVEGIHVGHAVVVDPHGSVVMAWGDPAHVIFPRSSNKPAQAVAMVRNGLDLPDDLLALAAASHNGSQMHLDGVRRILTSAGLDESALQTPADLPLGRAERDAWIAEGAPAMPIAMNCSGKHAAMLMTCVVNGWDTHGYRSADHPLQRAVLATVEELANEPVGHIGVDGCGAPVMSLTLAGLARTFSRLVQAPEDSPQHRVARAMRAHPVMVGGNDRDVTAFMQQVPGLLAKDGAEGVYGVSLRDGTAVAVKAEDGTDRARRVALARILGFLGCSGLEGLASIPMLGGGRPVGQVSSPLPDPR